MTLDTGLRRRQVAALVLIGTAYGWLIVARPSGWLAFILSGVVALAAIAAYCAGRRARPRVSATQRRWIALLIAGYGAVLAGRWLIQVVAMWAWPGSVAQDLTYHVLPSFDLRLLLVVAVSGPIIEEVLFRGVLFDLVDRDGHPIAAIVATSAAFAFVHWLVLGNAAVIASVFWLGAVLGTLRALTAGIALPVALHVVNNIVSEVVGLG